MKIQVKGRHVAVTDPMREYAEEKLEKVHRFLQERHIDDASRVELELWVEKNPSIANSQVAEATIFTKGPVIRAREASTDMYAAIDLVTEKLERRAKKYRDRTQHRAQRHKGKTADAVATPVPSGAPADESGGDNHFEESLVVKTKRFAFKPMSVDEATLQLELVGHDFFVFTNAETDATNVVYRRNDGYYGLIEPARQ